MYLQELLTKRDKIISIVNAGVWGYSSYQGEKRFEESLSLKPDMVLINFGVNDAHMVEVSDADFIKTTQSSHKPPFTHLMNKQELPVLLAQG